jgi:hypothetical protein
VLAEDPGTCLRFFFLFEVFWFLFDIHKYRLFMQFKPVRSVDEYIWDAYSLVSFFFFISVCS